MVATMVHRKNEWRLPHELNSKGKGGDHEKNLEPEKSTLKKGVCNKSRTIQSGGEDRQQAICRCD
jgi:hypothetical protein